MNKNVLLSFMIGCYVFPILMVIYQYQSNPSVSNIICDETCKNAILFFMGLMGVGTLLYEWERNDRYSQVCICVLLIGLYGLICVNESNSIHYVFAFLVFTAILCFMIRHYYITGNMVLAASLLVQILVLLFVVSNMNETIFYPEVIYILNFAFYYLYLHFST